MGSHASVFEQNYELNQYNLVQKRICAEFTITGSTTPASKQLGIPELGAILLLRTEGQTAVVDAIESIPYAVPDDGPTNSTFGVMIRGGDDYCGDIKKVLFIRVTDRSGTATSLTVLPYGVSGLTNGGNIAFSITGAGLDLQAENADMVIEIEYVVGNLNEPVVIDEDELNPDGVGPAPVDLGTAANYIVLAQSAITSAGTEAITGDMGVSPAAATSITGFSLVLDGGGTFSTSSEVVGNVYAADYAAPTPAELTQAISDKDAAYTDAMSRTPDVVNLNGGALGGLNLAPGVYSFTTAITIATDLTLTGGADDTWIFQSTGNLSIAASTDVNLVGGAVPENVVWAVVAAAGLGASSTMRGTIISSTTVTCGTGGTIEGRLLAGTAVTLDSTTITP